MKSKTNFKWAFLGLIVVALIMIGVVVNTNSTIPLEDEKKLESGDSLTVPIKALIDGPKYCFARIEVDEAPKFVNLGPYPACQEHTVGQEITVSKDDIEDSEESYNP